MHNSVICNTDGNFEVLFTTLSVLYASGWFGVVVTALLVTSRILSYIESG